MHTLRYSHRAERLRMLFSFLQLLELYQNIHTTVTQQVPTKRASSFSLFVVAKGFNEMPQIYLKHLSLVFSVSFFIKTEIIWEWFSPLCFYSTRDYKYIIAEVNNLSKWDLQKSLRKILNKGNILCNKKKSNENSSVIMVVKPQLTHNRAGRVELKMNQAWSFPAWVQRKRSGFQREPGSQD